LTKVPELLRVEEHWGAPAGWAATAHEGQPPPAPQQDAGQVLTHLHIKLQGPASELAAPASHSSQESKMPSPHLGFLQFVLHLSAALALLSPESHSSFASLIQLPQMGPAWFDQATALPLSG